MMLGIIAHCRAVAQDDLSMIWIQLTGYHFEEGGLARAVGADNGHPVPSQDFQSQVSIENMAIKAFCDGFNGGYHPTTPAHLGKGEMNGFFLFVGFDQLQLIQHFDLALGLSRLGCLGFEPFYESSRLLDFLFLVSSPGFQDLFFFFTGLEVSVVVPVDDPDTLRLKADRFFDLSV